MSDQNPFQPQALVGNPYSDAYFSAFRQLTRRTAAVCSHCNEPLSGHRMTDGNRFWCHEGCYSKWTKAQNDEKLRREHIMKFGKELPES